MSAQEKAPGMKEFVVSISLTKDSDSDSSKPSSKVTSTQSSPLIYRGTMTMWVIFSCLGKWVQQSKLAQFRLFMKKR